VNEDIDVDNADALLWAISYRSNPVKDIKTVDFRGQGHGPKREHSGEEDSSLLIDATMKSQMPPLALPAKQHMQRAMEIWQELGLPKLNVKSPWHGYSLGAWHEIWDAAGQRAAAGEYLENGRISAKLAVEGLKPETKVDPDGSKASGDEAT
jgi:4-hydroxy-3-polyprenylbenzoate decarboxylase